MLVLLNVFHVAILLLSFSATFLIVSRKRVVGNAYDCCACRKTSYDGRFWCYAVYVPSPQSSRLDNSAVTNHRRKAATSPRRRPAPSRLTASASQAALTAHQPPYETPSIHSYCSRLPARGMKTAVTRKRCSAPFQAAQQRAIPVVHSEGPNAICVTKRCMQLREDDAIWHFRWHELQGNGN